MANPENKQIPYESTQKDIRDAIESVATAIGGIAVPSADHVSYDNSVSGLSATDVQNAIDELSAEKADSSSLATVATSGDYDDLINKPTIPTVNDATLTIQKNGSDVATFTANASSNVTANITVPTTTSELTNNSNFVSDASYVHTDNNFTTSEKTKLSGIETGAEVNVQSDWNQTDNTADDYIKNKPSSEVKTATDTFTTVNGGLLEECIINLVPVQSGSGDPSPDNIRPISGHTEVDLYNVGKNKLPNNLYSDGSLGNLNWSKSADSKITIKATANNTSATRIDIGSVTLPSGTYILSGISNTSSQRVELRLRTGSVTGTDFVTCNANNPNVTFTLNEETTLYGVFIVFANFVDEVIASPMIRKSTDSADFEPYQDKLYQVQLGSTVYGGTVDLVSGVMRATHGFITYDGSNDEEWSVILASHRALITVSDIDISIADSSVADIISNEYKTVSYNDGYATTDGITGRYNISQINVFDRTNIDLSTTLEQWQTYLSSHPLQVCYKLATPLTIQLTPQQIETLVGQNNLSTPLDGQSIDSVKYREVFVFDDVEKVVSLRVPISMLGTDESGRTTASQAYSSGDYFYKDGYMCKALTSISAGATLTLNTNYSQGTLADILKAIENS